MKKLLFNPFEKFSEIQLLFFGIAITIIGSYIGYFFNGRFDGAIDLHFTNETTLLQPFIDNCINILSVAVILFFLGKTINKKTRFIDILIPAFVARLPFYLLPFSNFNNFMVNFTNSMLENVDLKNPMALHIETSDLISISLFAIVSIAMLVWFFVLLFHGFKIAANCKTPIHTLIFVIGIIMAEILSKTLIYFLNY
jgi:hypothetical protein